MVATAARATPPITSKAAKWIACCLGLGASPPAAASFQERVNAWMLACFGEEVSADRVERNHRFLEEALELVQATGCTASEAHQLVDYVFGRPIGDPIQEVGGVMVTLAALCTAHHLDMSEAGEKEHDRIWTKVEAIRAKHAAKPKHSPLPEPPAAAPRSVTEAEWPQYKCSMSIEHNVHLNYYETVQQAFDGSTYDRADITVAEKEKCLATGEVWMIQWYPITPIGFHCVAASSFSAALEAARAVRTEV